ncbi:hypothetical protein LRS06_05280 [Hymenobacter sp. J193]|uniref:hypothetical protein n=1 Tax=Hymenobacter sp. J193 TaxID=2898429 RepID=UPI002151D12D|nr:hypothetical protein [Hymenobacter sp. J193]MCR5887200.1 hypothetical protein [Hymenobacter sp. J193]
MLVVAHFIIIVAPPVGAHVGTGSIVVSQAFYVLDGVLLFEQQRETGTFGLILGGNEGFEGYAVLAGQKVFQGEARGIAAGPQAYAGAVAGATVTAFFWAQVLVLANSSISRATTTFFFMRTRRK